MEDTENKYWLGPKVFSGRFEFSVCLEKKSPSIENEKVLAKTEPRVHKRCSKFFCELPHLPSYEFFTYKLPWSQLLGEA